MLDFFAPPPATPSPGIQAHDTRRTRGRRNHLSGSSAEDIALRHCMGQGMTLVAQRVRNPAGEIDLVLRDGPEYVFLEVKASQDFDTALARITPRQVARVHRAAALFLETVPEGALAEARYDAALVNGRGEVSILRHALVGD